MYRPWQGWRREGRERYIGAGSSSRVSPLAGLEEGGEGEIHWCWIEFTCIAPGRVGGGRGGRDTLVLGRVHGYRPWQGWRRVGRERYIGAGSSSRVSPLAGLEEGGEGEIHWCWVEFTCIAPGRVGGGRGGRDTLVLDRVHVYRPWQGWRREGRERYIGAG